MSALECKYKYRQAYILPPRISYFSVAFFTFSTVFLNIIECSLLLLINYVSQLFFILFVWFQEYYEIVQFVM